MYADIDPSSFSNQQPRRQLHIPPIDDAPIEYAQVKHNCSQRVETSSMRKQPLSKKPNTTGIPVRLQVTWHCKITSALHDLLIYILIVITLKSIIRFWILIFI